MVLLEPKSSTAHVSLGAVYMDLKRPDDAEREFQKALRLNSRDPAAHFNLGNFYLSKDRRDDALGEFRKATELKYPLPDAWVNYALIQGELGKPEEASAAFKKALEIDSTNVRAITNLRNVLDALKRNTEPQKRYHKAHKSVPKDQEPKCT